MSFKWILTQIDKEKLQEYITSKCGGHYTEAKLKPFSIMSHILNANNCKSKWQLELFKHPYQMHTSQYVQLIIHPIKVTDPMSTFCLKYEIFVRTSGNDYCYCEGKSLFPVNATNPYVIPEFTREEIIACMLELQGPIEIIFKIEEKVIDDDNSVHPILQEIPDFEKLFNDPKFSDFIIICSEKEFNVHKNILAARSEVFSAMFELDMKEKNEGKVNIEDFTPEVVQELLRFMYCGKVENFEKLSIDLLRAAKKYFIGGLGDMCLESICKTLKTSNALELLTLAVDCKAHTLKSKIINFIVINLKEIRQQPDFKTISDPSLLREIIDKIVQFWL